MIINICATGDSLFCAGFPAEYRKIRGALDDFIGGCGVRMTNLETNISDFGGFACRYSGGTWLNTPPGIFHHLESFGFNFFGTANNHCMDYSYAGLLSTIDFLDRAGYAHAGTGRSLDEASRPAVVRLDCGATAAIFAVDTSMESPSMAGEAGGVFEARPGVSYLRHESVFHVSTRDMLKLKKIAGRCGVNFTRDGEIASGYMLPDRDGIFVLGQTAFTDNPDEPASRCNKADLERLTCLFRKAKEENDLVFLLVHCHDEEAPDESAPPAYLKEFCRAAINAGCDAVFGGGEHSMRGMELYRGRPVFYSLGDFIYQGMRVGHLPPDFMRKYGLDVNATAEEGLAARSKGGKIGLQTDEKNFLTVVPKITFENGAVADITLMPVKLGFRTGNPELDGLPFFAEGEEGVRIFERFRALSEPFGVSMEMKDGMIKVLTE